MTSVLQRWFRLTVVLVALVLGVTAAAAGGPVQAATASVSRGAAAAGVHALCAAPAPGQGTCAVVSATRSGARPAAGAATTPAGFSASNLRSAYAVPTTLGQQETVAVVTAYDDPKAESDMGTYRTQYSIPACTTANGCFKKVDQTGGSTYPPAAAGWSAADAESLDMVSAICPDCHIILVEANSSQVSDFGAAENEAATLGADAIDNDWQTPEGTLGSGETGYDAQYFDHPGVAITAQAGDTGYGVDYPAASQYVTAVGGTTLAKSTSASRGWTETAWAGTGSGCSAYEPKPWWQRDTGCSGRTLNDLSAVADPGTPVAFYDSPTLGGWNANSGGTAVAAAIIAAVYALGGTPAPGSYPSSYPYLHPGSFYAVTSGSNGTCSPAYLCTAGSGYNGPAGPARRTRRRASAWPGPGPPRSPVPTGPPGSSSAEPTAASRPIPCRAGAAPGRGSPAWAVTGPRTRPPTPATAAISGCSPSARAVISTTLTCRPARPRGQAGVISVTQGTR